NIENRNLLAALVAGAREATTLRIVEDEAASVQPGDNSAQVILENGATITARLIVRSDGPHSRCRTTPRIEIDTWSYPPTAVRSRIRRPRRSPNAVPSLWPRFAVAAPAWSGWLGRRRPNSLPRWVTRPLPSPSNSAPIRCSAQLPVTPSARYFRSRASAQDALPQTGSFSSAKPHT